MSPPSQKPYDSKILDCAKSQEFSPVVENPVVKSMKMEIPVVKSIELDNQFGDLGNFGEIVGESVSGNLDCDEVLVDMSVCVGESVVFGELGEINGANESETLETGDKESSYVLKDVDFEVNPLDDCGEACEIGGLLMEDEKVQLGKTLEIEGYTCDDSRFVDSQLNVLGVIRGKSSGEKNDDTRVDKSLEETTQLVSTVEVFTQQRAAKVEGVQVGNEGGYDANASEKRDLFRPPCDKCGEECILSVGENDGISMDDIVENADGLDGYKCREIVCSTSEERGSRFDRSASLQSEMFMEKCDCHRCCRQEFLFRRFSRFLGGDEDNGDELYRTEMDWKMERRYARSSYTRWPYGMRDHSICRRHSVVCNRMFDRRIMCDPYYIMRVEQFNQRLGCDCNEAKYEWPSVSDWRGKNRGFGFTEREHEWPQLTQFEPEPCNVGAGLANLGNTCFVNSIMQCFTHTVPFVEGLLSLKHDGSNHGNDEFCVLCAVRDQIENSLMSSGKVIYPSKLVDNLNHISSDFQRYQQEDAQELLMCLLDKLDSNWCKYETNSEQPSSSQDSLVKQIFGGRLVSQIRCCSCGHSSDKYDPVIGLSMEIDDVDDLQSALKSFTKVENLEGTEKISCDSCKEQVEAKKQLWLDQSPPIAVLHLKRFKSDGIYVEKIDRTVNYPLEFDSSPFTKGAEEDNDDLKYELFGIVVHVGFSSTSGHYFSFIRSSPDAWYRFDDSEVSKVSEAYALDQDAYILFYARKGTPWFSNAFESWKACTEEKMNASPKSVLDSTERPSTFSDLGAILRGVLGADKTDATTSDTSTVPSDGLKHDLTKSEVGAEVSVGANNNCIEPSTPITNGENPAAENCEDGSLGVSMETCPHVENHPCEPKYDVASTSPRPGSPDIYSDEEPAEETTFQIPQDHRKIQQKASSVKHSMGKAKLNLQKKEALRYVSKAMPCGRRNMFMAALTGSQPGSSASKKKRKPSSLISKHTARKRVKPSPKCGAPVAASV